MPRSFGSSRSRSNSRGSSRGSSSSPSYSSPRGYSRHQPQQTFTQTPMQRPSRLGGLGSTIAHGMAFGGGSEIGHQAVRAISGGGSNHGNQPVNEQQPPVQEPTQNFQKQNPCIDYSLKFVDCLKISANNISSCQNLFDDLKLCEKQFY